MKFKSKSLFAKLESVYGTPEAMAATDAIVTRNLQITPYQGNTVSLDEDRQGLGNQKTINTNPYVEVTFEVFLAGAGAAGTVPRYGPLMRACGLSETENAGTDVRYKPVSTGYESVTLQFDRLDDSGQMQRHVVPGARGTVSPTLSKDGIPVFSFRFIGFYVSPVQAAAITPDHTGFEDPLPISEAVTTLDIDGYLPIAESFSLDLAANLEPRNVINQRECLITDRAPTASMLVKAPDLDQKNFFDSMESHDGITTLAASIVHGVTAGKIVEIVLPQGQLQPISESDSSGELHYQLNMALLPATVDDEFEFIIR